MRPARAPRAALVAAVLCTLLQGRGFVALPSSRSSSDSPTLPALEHRDHPVAAWLSAFRESGGTSREALWSLFWSNERSSEVIDLLREELGRSRSVASPWSVEVAGWATSTSGALHREIDAILDHWEVEHECLRAEEFWDATMLQHCRDLGEDHDVFAAPVGCLQGSDDVLLERLGEGGPAERASAAAALIARGRGVGPALRELLHQWYEAPGVDPSPSREPARLSEPGETSARHEALFRWAVLLAGSEGERAIADLLTGEGEPPVLKAFLLDRVGLDLLSPVPCGAPVLRDDRALPAALAELVRAGVFSESARRELFRLCGVIPWTAAFLDPFDVTELELPLPPLGRPLVEEALARVVQAYLEADPEEWGVEPGARTLQALAAGGVEPTSEEARDAQRLLEIWWAACRSEVVLAAARPRLLAACERPGRVGREALRLLCAAGEQGPEVRAAYLRAIERVEPHDEPTLRRLPCLGAHDGETRAALERLFHRVRRTELLHRPLVAAGLLDAPREGELAREYLARLARIGAYERLAELHDGPRPPCTLHAADETSERVSKLLCNARCRRRHGEEPAEEAVQLWRLLRASDADGGATPASTRERMIRAIGELGISVPEFVDWGIELLADASRGPPSCRAAVVDLLSRSELTRRQQAALCHLEVVVLDDADAWPDLLARQGEASIERVVDLRRRAYLGRLDDLRRVLEITRPSALDLELLLRALDHGPATDREEALAILRDFPALDTPAVREGVRARALDCDDRVRDAAAALLAARGW